MGPFPHDAPPAEITKDNPAGTDGFEFVEFAHEDASKLSELFSRMGYSPVARHKTKDITVWRQGDINYILNAQPGSFAAGFVEKHGPCAPSMAWRVVEGDDPCLDQEDELFSLGIERIRESQAAGELRADLEPISIIKAFVAMTLHWFQTKTFLCQILGAEAADEQMDERYLDDILKIFFDGVRPR